MALWVFSGVAGSGKTSVAQAVAAELGWDWLDADAFHPEANRQKMRTGQALDEADREPWLLGLAEALAPRHDENLILAFPGLKRAHRRRIEDAVGEGDVHWAYLDVSLPTVEARLDGRGGFFPTDLAASQFKLVESEEAAMRFDAEKPLEALVPEAVAWVRSWHH